ncbi:MAG: S-layer homology domain-containing protein [Clostridiales bacterium]|nr:S-layer homology domain-containing protein [Clostridiales bacterium]
MKKKIVSLALVLALCLSLLPVTAFAEGDDEASTEVQTWGDLADTRWYIDHESENEYHISTAAQLAGLAKLVNDKTASVSFEGKTICLDNDLDLSGIQWTPIGNGDNFVRHFAGTFDGQHHKIMNLYHHYTGDELVRNGLFGVVSDGGTLKNLLVIDADIASNDGSLLAGILADWVNGGTVENCYTSGKIENNVGDKMVGGLIGQCTWSTQVKGCASDATVISTESDEDHVDTVGGLIGQWENSADSSSITDCWFGGSVSCNNIYSAVGGILGANFENFSGNKPGVIIKNCIVATKNITGAEPGNITWITAVVKTHVTDCIWPDTPPDGVTLDEEKYPDNKGNYLAVAKLVVDWDTGTAGADPTFDQSSCGTAVTNFTSDTVLASLNENAEDGITWVAGINHPTFKWDKWHISADYSAVDEALKNVPEDLSRYTDASVAKLNKAIAAVGKRDKNVTQQDEVNAMAQVIQEAIDGLVRKSSGSSRPRYDVTTPSKPENGSVTVDPERARSGSRVTVTVTPDSGYKLGELVVTDKDGKKLELTDKGNGQYTFTMPSGKVEVAAEFVKEVEVSPFADVATDAYYYDAVKWAVKKGITNGVSETLFGPDQACTRAQIVTFLWRAAGSPEPKSGSSFADVATDAYYAKAVAWAVENGITKGTSETTFHPDETCTRAQGVTFLYRALGKLAAAQAGFTDVVADSYYADAVNWAAENGVTKGISETLFGPDGSCTRAQIVTFLYRAYQGK